tara:strand:- start:268 stop:429 length:162 start_codon:yes stop_codon:yes gene_type:complete
MKINEAAWEKLKLQIEYHLKQDNNITDIKLNYQIKVPDYGTRNFLNLSAKISD